MLIEKWKPVKDIPEKLYVQGVYDDYEGLRIILKGSGNSRMLRIKFNTNLGYRNTNESERLKTLDENPEFCGGWPLFKVKDSDFIRWIIAESYEIVKKEDLTNYTILTADDIVEVISKETPETEWLN